MVDFQASHRRLKVLISWGLLVLVILSAGYLYALTVVTKTETNQSAYVEIASRQIILLHKISTLAEELARTPESLERVRLKSELADISGKIEQIYKGMVSGIPTLGFNDNINQSSQKIIQSTLHGIEKDLEHLLGNVEKLINTPDHKISVFLPVLKELGHQKSDNIATAYSSLITQIHKNTQILAAWKLRFTLIAGFIILIAILAVVFVILNPLISAMDTAHHELQGAQTKIREAEQFYRTVINSSAAGFAMFDLKARAFIEVNETLCDMLGYKREEMIGRSPLDFVHTRSLKFAQMQLETAPNTAKTTFKIELETKSKKGIFVHINASNMTTEDGQNIVVAFVSDLRELRARERQLVESEKRLYTIMQSAPNAIVALTPEGRIEHWNRCAEEMFEFSRDEALDLSFTDLAPPGEARQRIKKVLKSLSSDSTQERHTVFDLTAQRKDGSTFPAEFSLGAWTQDDGTNFCCIIKDQTSRYLREQRLVELSTAVEQSPSSIVITDTEGNIVYVNPTFCEVTGYESSEVLGKNPRLLQSGSTPNEIYEDLWRTISSGQIWRGTLLNKRKDGSVYWDVTSISPIFNDQGQIVRYIAIKEDITERKEIEHALEAERENNRVQQEFISMVSHEFRTPLAVIDSGAQRIQRRIETVSRSEISERMGWIRDMVERLSALVEKTLSLSRLQEGRIQFEPQLIDLRGLINEEVEKLQDDDHPITVDLDGLPDQISADPNLFRQIIWNLASNAIKYSKSGTSVEITGRKQNGMAVIDVSDHGVGIPENELPFMFQRFFRASTSVGISGTGIGLYIVKNLIDMHHGRIEVKSTEGEGSTFTIAFPTETTGNGEYVI